MIQKFFKAVEGARGVLGHKLGKVARFGEITTHAMYLGVVFLEAHGAYGLFAGIAGVALLAAVLIGGDGGEV